METYLLVGDVYKGGSDIAGSGRIFESSQIEFLADDDKAAAKKIRRDFGNYTNSILFKKVDLSAIES